ncbi:hypothetical protein FGO68_gene1662 [Halteria grandinella]|uniref:Uncharacterized protein n=1 Tax=Halteria grandinella TaxID=5974 RepID=A0A8J8T9N3_HALGN|nr:hypothetical protein FGO68_gene1662 [Halteria grandinella]
MVPSLPKFSISIFAFSSFSQLPQVHRPFSIHPLHTLPQFNNNQNMEKAHLNKPAKPNTLTSLLTAQYSDLNNRTTQADSFIQKLEAIVYNKLDNYRDESEMKYSKLREKQITQEQEKRLEEEISRKLSSVDQILGKARAKIDPSILKIDDEEYKRVGAGQKEKVREGIDLFRVYTDDSKLKSKNATISQLREVKKGCREQMKEMAQKEEAIRARLSKRFSKLGQMNKQVKGGFQGEIEELTSLCYSVVESRIAQKACESIVQAPFTQQYIKEATQRQGPEQKQFYDYYALWVLNKRLGDNLSIFTKHQNHFKASLPQHIVILKNTFIPGQTLTQQLKPIQKALDFQHALILCETELYEAYKQALKQTKLNPIGDLMTKVLQNKDLGQVQGLCKAIIDALGEYEEGRLSNQLLQQALQLELGSQPKLDLQELLRLKELIKLIGVRHSGKLKRSMIIYQLPTSH